MEDLNSHLAHRPWLGETPGLFPRRPTAAPSKF